MKIHTLFLNLLSLHCLIFFCNGSVGLLQELDQCLPLIDLCLRNDGLRVMTFNIRYGLANDGKNCWKNRRRLLMEVIRRNEPDILCLQEALYFQIKEIMGIMPVFQHVGVGRDDGDKKGEYCAILYNTQRFRLAEESNVASATFWLSDTPSTVASKNWGNNTTRICTWVRLIDFVTSRSLYVYNLHLDHVSEVARKKSIELLKQHINNLMDNDPIIITGDFNCGEDSSVVILLTGVMQSINDYESHSFMDTYRAVHPYDLCVGTFHDFKGEHDSAFAMSTEKIDFIFARPDDFEVCDATIDRTHSNGSYPSDHFPVTAHLRFKK